MAGFIHDRMETGMRISFNKGPKSAPSKTIVIDGGRGRISAGRTYTPKFGEASLASILGEQVGELLDWKMRTFGEILMSDLSDDPPRGTPVLTGLARANWQLSVVRSARSIGHTSRVFHRKVLDAKNENGRLANEQYAGSIGIPADYLRGLTELEKFSSRNGDYGIIVTNPIPYIYKLDRGHSKQSPAYFVEAAIAHAVDEAKRA